jgi:hypothetical protein
MSRKPDENYSEEEAAKRRDDALRRALNTPPKPHAGKPSTKRKRAKTDDKKRVSKSDS